ncbi:hypothetical protein MPSEU_000507600 [Mayamaea pseudoterrestris]|nr:hypothetical protein MPSEU_000507600 [Mayamaea pseudoterrestris]
MLQAQYTLRNMAYRNYCRPDAKETKGTIIGSVILLLPAFVTCSDALAQQQGRRIQKSISSDTSMSEYKETAAATRLEELQRKGAALIKKFEIGEEFHPKIGKGHVQTIFGFLLRESCSYVPRNESPIDFVRRVQNGFKTASKEIDNAAFWDERERIETPDNDWFHVDYKYVKRRKDSDVPASPTTAAQQPTPTVLLLHGLQSSSYGNLAVEMARAFANQEMNVIAINFRGCSKDKDGNNIPNDTLGAYHLGFTKDLLHFMEIFRQREPTTPIYLAGFSLGANVVLKCLGDLADQALDWNIQGAAALCAPLDQLRNAPVLARPFSIQRYVYTDGLLKSLQKMAKEQLERLQAYDKISAERIKSAETISEFDDAFIAPIYGFEDCWDYYRQTSSIHVLDKIAVPTLVLNAKNDPFFDNSVWPTHLSSEHGGPAPLKMVQCQSGGHLGFIFQQVDNDDERIGTNAPSLGSHAAAQFLQHVHRL